MVDEAKAPESVTPNLIAERWKDANAKVDAFVAAMKATGVMCSVQFTADGVNFGHATAVPAILQIGALEFAKNFTLTSEIGRSMKNMEEFYKKNPPPADQL